jgi:hypothetical protein
LPIAVLIPIYFAAREQVPKGGLLNQSIWNQSLYKPMNIALVFCTELFALITDILLLNNVLALRRSLIKSDPSYASPAKLRKMDAVSRDLVAGYIITWLFLLTDIAVKFMIVAGTPVLFDSIVTIATIAMRARCNLQYGLNMRHIFSKDGTSSYGDSELAKGKEIA